MNSSQSRRLPAEWEYGGAVLMAWPHKDTDWAYMLDDVEQCYMSIIKALTSHGVIVVLVTPDVDYCRGKLVDINPDYLLIAKVCTNDTWTRDYGPIIVEENDGQLQAVDFKFNGWGLKFAACYDNLVTSSLIDKHIITTPRINQLSFVLEGGSIESDGNGILLTTSECLLSPNRNGSLDREQIETHLKQTLGVKSVLWLDHGALMGDDTDSHIDTLARLAPNNSILYVGTDDVKDPNYQALSLMEQDLKALRTPDGMPFNLLRLPLPDAIYDEDGNRLPATYANYLVTPHVVFMPTYNQHLNDQLALQMLKVVFPQHEIVPVDCQALIRQHGSLHCATMQLPRCVICI